jgi:hypothetical protein
VNFVEIRKEEKFNFALLYSIIGIIASIVGGMKDYVFPLSL